MGVWGIIAFEKTEPQNLRAAGVVGLSMGILLALAGLFLTRPGFLRTSILIIAVIHLGNGIFLAEETILNLYLFLVVVIVSSSSVDQVVMFNKLADEIEGPSSSSPLLSRTMNWFAIRVIGAGLLTLLLSYLILNLSLESSLGLTSIYTAILLGFGLIAALILLSLFPSRVER